MNKRAILSLVTLLSLLALFPAIGQEAEPAPGILLQVGAGKAFPSYPSQTEAALSYVESQSGVDRIQLSLDLALGVPIGRQAFVLIRVDGSGDRLFDSIDYVQLNLYLYSLGLRYLPLGKGLYLEAGAGMSKGALESSAAETSYSDPGFGYTLAIGYDFNPSTRGLGLALEARYLGLSLDDADAGVLVLTLNLCWK